jgi:hypothetical protein
MDTWPTREYHISSVGGWFEQHTYYETADDCVVTTTISPILTCHASIFYFIGQNAKGLNHILNKVVNQVNYFSGSIWNLSLH